MNVLIVSGIWPPDVGGPASHAPELAEQLQARGHGVEVVITADGPPRPERYPVHWISRRLPRGVRHVRAAATIARRARRADVVYTTGMLGRTSLASLVSRRPVVMKLTSDPTYERSLRYRFFAGDLDSFQTAGGARVGVLRRSRDFALRRAAHLVVPSDALRRLALGWGIGPDRVTLLPNPVSVPAELPARDELRTLHGFDGPTLAFAGRLVPQKSLEVALEALAHTDDIVLVLAGDGPEEARLRDRAAELGLGERARFLGAQPRNVVFELLRAADAALLSSSWENFPHVVVEALAVGTPVLATRVGGVPEIVRDGENGLLVPIGDAAALGDAIRRYFADASLRDRLRAATGSSVDAYAPEGIYARLIEILERAARATSPPARSAKPRLLLVGRTRYGLPLDETRRRKFDALGDVLELRVLGSAAVGSAGGDGVFTLVPRLPVRALDGLAFHSLLPLRVAREIKRFRPSIVLVQGAHEAAFALVGRSLARSRAPIVLDVHGDWRTATRLYGSRARRLLNPVADRIAAWAVRRVDAVRTVSGFTTGLVRELGVEPAATFPAFMDLAPFLAPPVQLPERPRALFVGVLELYKGIDLLVEAWPLVARDVPDAELRLIGSGRRVELARRLVARGPAVTWDSGLSSEEVAAELDAATCLVLPSRREGMGRVVVEAFCRGRAVVGTRGGGIEDLVTDGETGLLVPPNDARALAAALVRILTDRPLAERLGFGARTGSEQWYASPQEYAERVRALVEHADKGD